LVDPAIDSNILHMYAAGNDFIIVNSFDAAIELGDKRSAIYSSRSVSVIPERCTISIPLKARVYDAPRIVSYIPFTKKTNFPLSNMDSTGWAGNGALLVWFMETLGENVEACFKSIFIRQIHNSIDPSR
jgi:hypothetical protein